MSDILQIRAPGYNFYVLKDGKKLYLIDGGFIGGWFLLKRFLRKVNWERYGIEGILVTHGHLDHILNLNHIKEKTGAWIAAPKKDALHYKGQYPYRGLSRGCGWLEWLGRKLLGFKTFPVDRYLQDGDVIDIWDGIKAVQLPGHTMGHMGYYSESRKTLFSGDLFASYGLASHWPPAIFNSSPDLIEGNREKVLNLNPEKIYPSHADRAAPEIHLQRLKRLKKRQDKSKGPQ